MNYEELKKAIASKAGFSIANTGIILNAFKKVITDALLKDEKIVWTKFLKIESRKRPEGIRANPKTGEKINVPEKYVPHPQFTPTYKDDFNKEKSIIA